MSNQQHGIDIDGLDDEQREALLSKLLERDGVLAPAERDPARGADLPRPSGSARRSGVDKPKSTPAAAAPSAAASRGAPIVEYRVPEGVLDDLASSYQVTDQKQLTDAAVWTANQFRELYARDSTHRQVFWGALERAAFHTLVHNRALGGESKKRAEKHLAEFDEFLDSVPKNERGAFLDLPSLAAELTGAQADRNFATTLRLLRTRVRRLRRAHLHVYADFLRVARLFAVLTRKEAEYKARGIPDEQIKRKIAAAREIIYKRVADTDAYVVLIYVEILRNALSTATRESRANAHDRLTSALAMIRETLDERKRIDEATLETVVAEAAAAPADEYE